MGYALWVVWYAIPCQPRLYVGYKGLWVIRGVKRDSTVVNLAEAYSVPCQAGFI